MGTISEKLTYLNGTKQLLKDKINNLGGSIDEHTTFRQYANQLQNVYDNLPKTEYQEGTEVNLGKTIKGKLDYDEDNGKKVVGIGQSSQDGEPTPTNEVPIQCVTGNIEEVVGGKNLVNISNSESGGIDASGNLVVNSQNWRGTEFIQVKPNTQYTVSAIGYNSIDFQLRLYQYDENKNFISPRSQGTTSTPLTIITETNTRYLKWTIYLNNTPITTEIANTLGIMLCEGTDTTYEPYITPTSYQLSLGDIELNAIGTYKDELVTDRSTGKWYKLKNIERTTLSNFAKLYTADFFGVTKQYGYLKFSNSKGQGNPNYRFYCDKVSKSNGVANDYSGYFNATNFIVIASDNDTLTTFNEKISGSDFCYVLATPTLTEITDTNLINQLENWYNAKSINGTTIITSNGNLPMIIKVRGLKGE